MASLRQNSSSQDLDSCKRKALLILGASVFPFLAWRSDAFEAFASGKFWYFNSTLFVYFLFISS